MIKNQILRDIITLAQSLNYGDDEQTRIDNIYFLNKLPIILRDACRYLIDSQCDYDGAIIVFCRYHLNNEFGDYEVEANQLGDAILKVYPNIDRNVVRHLLNIWSGGKY